MRRIRALAKATRVPLPIVHALCDLRWDFDPGWDGEPLGWIEAHAPGLRAQRLLEVAVHLGLEADVTVSRGAAVEAVLAAHSTFDDARLWSDLEVAGATKNTALLSRFATWHYLRGLDRERLEGLAWEDGEGDLWSIASALFLKVFRAGAVDRASLIYAFCDLTLPLAEDSRVVEAQPWIRRLLIKIDAVGPEAKLTDLIRCTTGLVKGDKYFKQSILEALAFAGALRVREIDVAGMFLPAHHDDTSSHFHSNEWRYPLNFWTQNGGDVDLSVLPDGEASG